MLSVFSAKFKKGNAVLLVVGVVIVLGIVLGLVFGPKIQNFGQLSLRQEGQESKAAAPGADDADKDGFTDKVERFIGTDPKLNCGTNAWPPDFNNDKNVNQTDVDLLQSHFATKIGNKNYDKRFDLNADKSINLSDTFALRQFYNSGCPFYWVTTSATSNSVTFNWNPPLPKITYPQLLQIYYGDLTVSGKTECNSPDDVIGSAGALTNTDSGNLYLKEGATSYTWSSQTSNYQPVSGHRYCFFFDYRDVRTEPGRAVSSYMDVTIPAGTSSPTP